MPGNDNTSQQVNAPRYRPVCRPVLAGLDTAAKVQLASRVLKAMGLPNARARNSLRFSLGPGTTVEEVDFVVGVLPRLVARLRQLGRPAVASQ